MRELTPDNKNTAEIDAILSRCVIKDGKLVPADTTVIQQTQFESYETETFDDQNYLHYPEQETVQEDEVPEDAGRRKKLRTSLARAAVVGIVAVAPIQAADAYVSNRPFFEVNIITDGIHAAENAALIAENAMTAFNNTKSTIENISKLANGGN